MERKLAAAGVRFGQAMTNRVFVAGIGFAALALIIAPGLRALLGH